MITLQGYDISEQIYASQVYLVYKAVRKSDGLPVILKTTSSEYANLRDVSRLGREFEIASNLQDEAVPQYLGLEQSGHRTVLVIQDFGGQSLRKWLLEAQPGLTRKLDIAISIVEMISHIHQMEVVHKDIKSGNIIINPETGVIKMIDFGLSTRMHNDGRQSSPNVRLEGTLAYISPEQTGRINQSIGFGSDFYSLGVVLYELFTGQLPFDFEDPLKMVHCHLAVMPESPSLKNPEIPDSLSGIILKLLAKSPVDRYHSGFGIQYDLRQVKEILQGERKAGDFKPGIQDRFSRFNFVERLVGRDSEISLLKKAVNKAAQGIKEIVFIAGPPGIGKTSLVKEINAELAGKNGILLSGKFDQLRVGNPYYGIIRALSELLDYILKENEKELGRWARNFKESLGGLGDAIIDLAPEYEILIGKQQGLPDVLPEEARNRYEIALLDLIKVVATEEHPLVLFLDDLQWADNSSLRLLESLITDPEFRYLLILGAYRDNEVSETHPFRMTMDRIREQHPAPELNPCPISDEEISVLLAESLGLPVEEVRELGQAVFERTRGNPFFVRQLVLRLREDKVITLDQATGKWTWDKAGLEKTGSTENVIDYLIERVTRIEPATLELLKMGSCIGNRFEVFDLEILHRNSLPEIMSDLGKAIDLGLINAASEDFFLFSDQTGELADPSGNNAELNLWLEFSHDRIRESVYQLLGEQEKQDLHYRIGKGFLEKYSDKKLEEELFEVVAHLNQGEVLIAEPTERLELAKLNLRAATKAKMSSGFSLAGVLLEKGLKMLPGDAEHKEKETWKGLYFENAIVQYLIGEAETAHRLFEYLIDQAGTRLEKLQILTTYMQLAIQAGQFKETLPLGAQGMALFGITMPEKGGALKRGLFLEMIKARFGLWRKSDEQILKMKPISDKEVNALLDFMGIFSMGMYAYSPELFAWVQLKGLNLTLKNGLGDPLNAVFMYYGLIILSGFGDYQNAYRYGKISMKLFEVMPSRSYPERVEFAVLGWIGHWKEDIRPFLEHYQRIYARALEFGDLIIADWAMNQRVWTLSCLGAPLEQVLAEGESHEAFLSRIREDQSLEIVRAVTRMTRSLRGQTEHPWTMNSEGFSFEDLEAEQLQKGGFNVLAGYTIKRLQLRCLFGRDEEAMEILEKNREHMETLRNSFFLTEYYLYEAIVRISLIRKGKEGNHRKELKKILKTFRDWIGRQQENFAFFSEILEAEMAELSGKFELAEKRYEQAIATATQRQMIHHQALANELAARHFIRRDRVKVARVYLEEARYSYLGWGAVTKAEHLESEFREYFHSGPASATHHSDSGTLITVTHQGNDQMLDLMSLLKSSTTISGEIRLDSLLKALMNILIENAGAETGFLLMNQGHKLVLQARGTASGEETEVLQGTPVFGSGILPESLVHYVDHKGESIVLREAWVDPRFGQDPYFAEQKTLSVMCVPILSKGKVLAIIYLENNLSPGIFTAGRIEVIRMLSGQIAVSLENALVYENLETRVRERTAEIRRQKEQIEDQKSEIEIQKRKSDDLLLNILPAQIAEELKVNGKAKARKYDTATVLFTDIQGFTQIAEKFSPEELVEELDTCFSAFDAIMEKHGLEKVKTIGDAYMAMSGVPVPSDDSAKRAVAAALEIRDWLLRTAEQKKAEGKDFFRMRIGLHTGEVIAGVVGTKKFAYDIWGDTVNMAARMEAGGKTGKVNISADTFNLVRDHFECEHRGKLHVKNKGEVDMYFVEGKPTPAGSV